MRWPAWIGGLLALLPALLAASAPAAAEEELRFRRPIEVVEPGWQVVELSERAARSGSLQLLGADGRPVDLHLPPEQPPRRRVRVVEVAEGVEHWWIVMDLSRAPHRHSRLYFDLANPGVAEDCRLEASDDRRQWRPLARGGLFRIGSQRGLSESAIDYPAGDWRYLRLGWPRDAGEPEVRSVRVLADRRLERKTLTVDGCETLADGRSRCRLAVPPGLDQVELTVDGEGPYGLWWNLWVPLDEPLSGLTWFRGPSHTITLAPETDRRHLQWMRVDLWAEEGPGPRLLGAVAVYEPPAVYFDAEVVGTYTLAHGGRRIGERRGPPGGAEPVAWHEVAPEADSGSWPSLPGPLVDPAVPLPEADWTRRWSLQPGEARAGDLVELRLPDELRAWLYAGDGLRLAVGERQLPFVRMLDWELESERTWPGLRPASAGTSRVEIDNQPPLGGRLLELFSRSSPFERRVTLTSHPEARPGVPVETRRPAPVLDWSCPAVRPAGCALTLPLGTILDGRLELAFEDGDNPPIAELTAELWRQEPRLRFVWPEAGSVDLLLAPGLRTARYELTPYEPLLAERPALPVRISGSGEPPRSAAVARWLLPASFGLAALVLLAMLRRLLRDPT